MVGLGDLGGKILEILARTPGAPELIVGDIDEEGGALKVNNAVIGAVHHDLHPHFRFTKVELNDIEGTAQLIKEISPSVVINCAVMQTWNRIRNLPPEVYSKLSAAALGAWLPVQLTLAYNLAQAIQQSGVKPYYINTSLSDLTNVVLGKVGLPPTIGLGNVDLIVPALQTLIANELKVPRNNITIYLVAHHVHWVYPREAGYREGAPYYLKVMLGDKDISAKLDKDRLMYDAVKLYPPGIDFTMGVYGFGDFAQQPWGGVGDHVVHRHQDLTATKATFVAGVNSLSAAGGLDFPEAQLEALHYIATPAHPAIDSNGDADTADPEDTPAGLQPTWRPGAQKVILLVTDALCHVTGDAGGWPGDAGTTSVAVTGGILDAADISVIGLVPGGAGTNACVDAIAAATGGTVQATTDTGEDIKAAILAGLEQLTTDVWWTVTADPGLTVELSPDVHYDVPGGSTVNFTETITVDEAVPIGEILTATVTFWANSYPAEGGIAGEQTIRITVRQVVGGEIADERTLMVMAPWLALSIIALGGGSAILVRRKALIKSG